MEDDPDKGPPSPLTTGLQDIEMRDTVVVESGASGGALFLPDDDAEDSADEEALAAEASAHAERVARQTMQMREDAALEYQHALEDAEEESDDDEEDDEHESDTPLTGDEDDPVVRTIPIVCTKALTPYLHYFAYPARKGKDSFEDTGSVRTAARVKPESGQIEIDVTVADENSPYYNKDRATHWTDAPLQTMTLGGQVRPIQALHAWYNKGVLHVTPVEKYVQLRPNLSHIDARDREDKETKRQDALAEKPNRAAKTVQLSAKSNEVPAEQASTSVLLREAEEEPWQPLEWFGEGSAESWQTAELLMAKKKQVCKSLTTPEQYLEMLSTVPGDGKEPKINVVKIEG